MDQALAVVIGAAIAFIASFFGTVATPLLTARIVERKRRRDEIREALIEVTDALTRMWHYRQGKTQESAFRPTMAAIAKLGLNVASRDRPIEQLAVTTLQVVQRGDDAQVAAALGAWQKVSGEWFRGELRSIEVLPSAKKWATSDEMQARAWSAGHTSAG